MILRHYFIILLFAFVGIFALPVHGQGGCTLQELPDTVVSGVYRLPATVAFCQSGKKLPAVVLVHGSGPTDRDETLLGNKPFRDLAHGLAARGFLVLRYDKRTLVYKERSVADPSQVSVDDDTVDDALAAVARLKRLPTVDKRRIFVLGHSQGAWLAPRIAQRSKDVRGIVMLAAPARPMAEILREQVEYLSPAFWTDSMKNVQFEQLKNAVPASFWRSCDEYDHLGTARGLRVPMLILQGGRDYQVSMDDFRLWQQALAGRPNVKLRHYPSLNHLFMEGVGKSTPTEYYIAKTVSEEVVDDIADFLGQAK